jgi:hypothetical protein
MRVFAAWLVLAIVPAWAQLKQPVSAPGVALPASLGPRITPQSFTDLENRFDSTLKAINPVDQVDVLGSTRAVYLQDYGVVITTEISLIITPSANPFRSVITDKEKEQVHRRKTLRVPLVQKTMRELVKAAAMTLAGAMGLDKAATSPLQVVYAVRCLYLPYENTTGLPAQIVMRATLANAIADKITEEIQ